MHGSHVEVPDWPAAVCLMVQVTGTQAIKSMYHTYEQFSYRTQGSGFSKVSSRCCSTIVVVARLLDVL